MEMGRGRKISKEAVLENLKDDGDFDRLRLKIIRRLKENEELRNNMISVVKESSALNRLGAQNMKTRQLSDAIYEEVGSKMLSQLSDGLWGIIRSEEGMKNEIRETVETVYATLANPGGAQQQERLGLSSKETVHKIPTQVPGGETSSCPQLENKPEEPPGFGPQSKQKQELIQGTVQENKGEACSGISNIDNSDEEDPELPPGFG